MKIFIISLFLSSCAMTNYYNPEKNTSERRHNGVIDSVEVKSNNKFPGYHLYPQDIKSSSRPNIEQANPTWQISY